MTTKAASMLTTTTTTSATTSTNTASSNTTTTSSSSNNSHTEDEQLSNDLALFLSNPSLRAALADGSLNLASYSTTVQLELQALEEDCIAVYHEQAANIAGMATELSQCRAVLAALHEMLLGFQADLSGLSVDIRQLQQTSRTLDVQLRNRRRAEAGIRHFLQECLISPTLAQTLTTAPVNSPAFGQAVLELETLYRNTSSPATSTTSTNKSKNSSTLHTTTPSKAKSDESEENKYNDEGDDDNEDESSSQQRNSNSKPVVVIPPWTTAAGQELHALASTLRLLTVSRIRDYFLQQLSLLRRPQTNVRMIQVHGLLKHAALQQFLQAASPTIAQELFAVYSEGMSKTLLQLFRTYQAQLLQLDATRAACTRQDVLAMEESAFRDALTTKAKKRNNIFALGRRAVECLPTAAATSTSSSQQQQQDSHRLYSTHGTPTQQQHHHHKTAPSVVTTNSSSSTMMFMDPPIVAHVALAENTRYPYERLYKSLLGHLVHAVTNEHVFCRQFFQRRDAFAPLFSMTLSALLEHIETYLFGCYDAICLLLMIQVTHAYKRLLHQRCIYSLDATFLDPVSHLLWPRLKMIMDLHLRSLQQATPAKLGIVGTAASDNNYSSFSSSSQASAAAAVGTSCHYVTRRYADFACSLLLILNESSSSSSGASQQGGGAGAATPHRRPPAAGNRGVDPQPNTTNKGTTNRPAAAASASAALLGQRSNSVGSIDTIASERYSTTGSMGSSSIHNASVSGHPRSNPNQQQPQPHKTAGDKVLEDLSEITDAYLSLLERLAEAHASATSPGSSSSSSTTTTTVSLKQRIVFSINNLDHVVCTFQERRVPVTCRELSRFIELLLQQRELFVEEELLSAGFSKMIAFVQQTEAHLAALANNNSSSSSSSSRGGASSTSLDVNEQVVESLVLDFASHWKQYMEQINRDVLSYFSNFRNGMEILKQVLTQLLLYYTRFQDCLRKLYRQQQHQQPAFTKDLVSTTVILAEIKKYALAI